MRKVLLVLVAVTLALTALPSCMPGVSMYRSVSFEFFDTVTELVGYTVGVSRFNEVNERVRELLKEHHEYFDIYNTYGDTVNLATVNATAGQSERSFSVSREIYELLSFGKEMYELTSGEVNVAMGSVLSLWHECRENTASPTLPSSESLEEASEHADINGFSLTETEDGYILTVTDPKLKFDVGAIAKGYTAQRLTELIAELRRDGESFMLNLGGMVCPIGAKPDGSAWVAGVEVPGHLPQSGYLCRVSLSEGALVTSAAHLRMFTVDGKSYSHIIDSETLYPPEYFASVTVLADDAALGDALSTALFCMTEEEGRALLKKLPEVEAMWVYSDLTVSETERFNSQK